MEQYELMIQRIDAWLNWNKKEIGNRTEDFRNFLYNFTASYPEWNSSTQSQLFFDLREQKDELWTSREKLMLFFGVFSAYNPDSGLQRQDKRFSLEDIFSSSN